MICISLQSTSEVGTWEASCPEAQSSQGGGVLPSWVVWDLQQTQWLLSTVRKTVRTRLHTWTHHRRTGHHPRRHPGWHWAHRTTHRSHGWHSPWTHWSHSSRSHPWSHSRSHSSRTHWSHGRPSQALRRRDGVAGIFAEFPLHEGGSGGVYQ